MPTNMKYFIYRLEITDGLHGYFSSGLCEAKDWDAAVKIAGHSAKEWYEGEEREKRNKPGDLPCYAFTYQDVICAVDQVEEIPEEDYKVLTQYRAYI